MLTLPLPPPPQHTVSKQRCSHVASLFRLHTTTTTTTSSTDSTNSVGQANAGSSNCRLHEGHQQHHVDGDKGVDQTISQASDCSTRGTYSLNEQSWDTRDAAGGCEGGGSGAGGSGDGGGAGSGGLARKITSQFIKWNTSKPTLVDSIASDVAAKRQGYKNMMEE